MKILDFDYIRNMGISAQQVYDWCNEAWRIKDECILPAKTKMWQGESGRYVTMPCVFPELDIAGVKFIARNVDDASLPPARNSHMMVQRCSEMGLIGVVDGMWITNMRTGAIAANSAIKYSRNGFETLGIMGLGLACRAFMHIFGNVFKRDLTVKLLRYKDQAESFIERFAAEFDHLHFEVVDTVEEICSCDTVVSAVSFVRDTIAPDDVFKPGCTVVPIHTAGFQNCDLFFDKIIIDDHGHVKGFKYYDTFKDTAIQMSSIEKGEAIPRDSDEDRVVAYCGGLALHDIYIASKVLELADDRGDAPTVEMHFPQERFWV